MSLKSGWFETDLKYFRTCEWIAICFLYNIIEMRYQNQILLSKVSKYIRVSSDYLMLQKAPGEEHCFVEQCQSKENNQKGHNFIFTWKIFIDLSKRIGKN